MWCIIVLNFLVPNVYVFRGEKKVHNIYEFDLTISIGSDVLWTASGDEQVCSSFSMKACWIFFSQTNKNATSIVWRLIKIAIFNFTLE